MAMRQAGLLARWFGAEVFVWPLGSAFVRGSFLRCHFYENLHRGGFGQRASDLGTGVCQPSMVCCAADCTGGCVFSPR